MRRWTFITIIVLFVLILVAAIFQIRAAGRGSRRFPGPGFTVTPPTPSASSP
jgi:hypothetical protein